MYVLIMTSPDTSLLHQFLLHPLAPDLIDCRHAWVNIHTIRILQSQFFVFLKTKLGVPCGLTCHGSKFGKQTFANLVKNIALTSSFPALRFVKYLVLCTAEPKPEMQQGPPQHIIVSTPTSTTHF